MSYILHRKVDQEYPGIVRGDGVWAQDSQGRWFLDAISGGAAVSSIGLTNARVRNAIAEQLDAIPFYHTTSFTSEPAEALAEDLIVNQAPDRMARVLYCSGGSEAIEMALKVARQFWVERGEPGKSRIIARRQSYHGATLGALAIGGNQRRRETYAPLLFDASLIDPCYSYRFQRDGETDEDYGRRAADALEAEILRLGAENVACFIAEPVVGATLGSVPAAPGYLQRIREICDRYDILLILDEVMCGSGRTGYAHACLEDGVSPDILALAKGLGGGFQPLGAVLVSSEIADAFRQGSGLVKHGYTYMGHAAACSAALAVRREIRDNNLLENVAQRGSQLTSALERRLGDHPHVGNIRGRGLLVGIELVRDVTTKEPFPEARPLAEDIKQQAFQHGLLVYPGSGTADGENGHHVLLAPAYTVSEEEIEEIVVRLERTLDSVFAQ